MERVSAHLLTNGIIHSVSDPYATAVLVADGVIAWLGGDDSADRVAGAEVPRLDLAGAVVAPTFVEPRGTAADARAALGRGTAVVTVLEGWDPAEEADEADAAVVAPRDASADAVAPGPVATVRYRAVETDREGSAGLWLATDGRHAPAELAGLVAEATRAGEQAFLVAPHPTAGPDAGGSGDADAVARAQAAALAALRAAADALGTPALGRLRHRLDVTGPVSAEDRALLAATGTCVHVAPDAAGVLRAPVASLLADAVPVTLGAGVAGDPWAAVRAALAHPDEAERISARSAFTAATRTGLRALPDVPAAQVEASPRLVVSAGATFAVWDADAVTVQSPDGRVAAWSTDTRAGTPLLPALDAETALPRWAATWVDGEPVAQAADAPDGLAEGSSPRGGAV